MRLIDADALLKEHCDGCGLDIQEMCKRDPVCASAMWVVEAPTIDAVPVVRCKDCKFSKPKGRLYECPFFDEIRGDEYCSSGERRSND